MNKSEAETPKKITPRCIDMHVPLLLYLLTLHVCRFFISIYNSQTYDRENIADALVGKSFSAGEAVVRQGDDADGMYFVEVSLSGFHIFLHYYTFMFFDGV